MTWDDFDFFRSLVKKIENKDDVLSQDDIEQVLIVLMKDAIERFRE